ncbi:serine/threonine protein phosphatase [Flavobacterium amniphilum]|uniref:metallophosphoesterase family protein n=1 Tax=Flavobacterium amniphilum TaxID=1834035 RepID=UPI00202AA34B|nr:metallophosphoesterase family protein [Flavobacterium amniphilum]MCL9805944.1 serine/threonine protein phosphatase [Flavobacterium amniphilum]
MGRTLVFGDIHGGLRALEQLLERVNPQPEDTLIFLGDYVDGWSESAQVIAFLIDLYEKHNCIFIKGNHDLWCGRWLSLGATNPVWEENGGRATIKSYIGTGLLSSQAHKSFFENLKDYHLDDQNRLFIHAGYTSIHGVAKEVYESNYYFDRTLWEMAITTDKMIAKDSKLFPKRLLLYKEIYVGHTPTTNYDSDKPMQGCNVWNIDTGAGFSGKLSCIDIDTKEFWQSDTVQSLYPDERGRN